jgi:hypothetical protein
LAQARSRCSLRCSSAARYLSVGFDLGFLVQAATERARITRDAAAAGMTGT